MGRDTERLVGAGLFVGGALALAVPVLVYRTWSKPLGVVLGLLVVVPAVLAMSAGRKLRAYPPRREITLEKLRENARWYRLWERLGLA
ncbi:hypothetical protein [Halorientalis litorea]|jgi:hypothetical protein|uniref:hypothetical protein n=1 Tax=Halorientalis litorea TaxID=2931977 RepID=UPI001FF35699|nr:hypothetical protein [Halorientalis litorea]